MAQETNLNVAPYFDDFDANSNYYQVLFKPAFPVQARELNNLQSILQNQVEKFGEHVFKEGAKVIPGQTTYLSQYYAIQIDPTYLGVPVSLYLDQILGTNIVGATSGITAKVVNYITDEQSEKGTFTLYVNYIASASSDATTDVFFDDEVLSTTASINYASTFIGAGEGFAKTLAQGASAIGSAFNIGEGVYFLRGHFVQVYDDTLILSQYSNKPSYRIGFNVREEIISPDIDPTLNDNSQGYNNYTAPGADRFKITARLFKKDPDDFDDSNFVQLAEVQNGILRQINSNTDYNYLADELARRTFDESGHYYVKAFDTTVKNSLNNGFGNRGIYTANQKTTQGNTPSKDLAVYKIGPGKAYVKGYEVDIKGPSYLDVEKPRTTNTLESQGVNFNFGPTFTVNRVYGSPTLGFDTDNVISLRSERVGSDQKAAAGKEIGVARIYDFALESGSYDSLQPDTNKWDISLFDVQTYTEFDVNESVTLNVPTRIKGESSGATAYLRHSVVGTGFTAYEVQGEFTIGERLTFNGVETNARTVLGVTNYETSDAKSFYSIVGSANTFTADLIQSTKSTIGIASISAESGGFSTVDTPTTSWPGITSVGNLVEYSIPTNEVPSLAKVTEVTTNTITIAPVETVSGYRIGSLPTSDTTVTDFKIVETKRQAGTSESLYSVLPMYNVESVDTTSSTLNIRRSYTVSISNNSTSAINTNANESFLSFDEERYTLIRSDGTTEVLTQDKFSFSNGNTTLIINGLGAADPSSILTTTIVKNKITSKVKQRTLNNSIIIDKSSSIGSGIGGTTLNDGLEYGSYPFGTRVQDESISINVPDANLLYGVYESVGIEDPVTPSMTTGSIDGPTSTTDDLIIGDQIIGTVSGAMALYFQKKTDTSVDFIYMNKTLFLNGEVINFVDSGVSAIALNIDKGSNNITDRFTLSSGQKTSFYDIARIKRKPETSVPSRKLKVCFASNSYDASDTGDITTASSYSNFDYGNEIPSVNGFRCSDLIDMRPRVSDYTVSPSSRSPFEFYGRSFNGGQHSSKDVIASDETMILGFSYYQGRMDRVYLSPDGVFTLKKGVPSDNPELPDPISGSMNIANVSLPPYLYSTNQATISFVKHKRYQMSDIAKLDERLTNIEYYTSLNQLESNAINQFTPDANGLDRFKSGIFVDNFTTPITQDPNLGVKNSIDRKNNILRPSHYSTAVSMTLGNNTITGIGETTSANNDKRFADILGTNVRRQSSALMLDYTETPWLNQPFATKAISVTPYMVTFWAGAMVLTPDTDVWIDVNQMEANEVVMEGSFEAIAQLVGAEVTTDEDGNRTGVTPIIWDSWETNGVNVDVDSSSSSSSTTNTSTRPGNLDDASQVATQKQQDRWNNRGETPQNFQVEEETTTTTTTTTTSVSVELEQSRTGTQITVNESIDTESLGESIVSREVLHFMRSRAIDVTCTSMKPFTQLYPFFDGVDVGKFSYPKLVEIEMQSGIFLVGETVIGVMPTTENNDEVSSETVPYITFRVASSNHKYGPYNDPSDVYDSNPYNRELNIPSEYSETSTLINIDTFSLQDEEQPEFEGYINKSMTLRGQTSGAEALVTFKRMITDRVGTLQFVFQVPSSSDPANPTFETGQSRMRVTSSSTNSKIEGTVTTSAETTFYSQGTVDNTQETTLSLKNAEVEVDDSFFETRTLSDTDTSTTTSSSTTAPVLTGAYTDPLAQSFVVDDQTGVFVTSIDLYFQAIPEVDKTPVMMQIREMGDQGQPNKTILPYSAVDIHPDTVTTSQDGTVATNVKFQAPVFLEPNREYAVILMSHNTEYVVWISKLGQADVSTLGQEEGQIIVSTQPTLGSLFKSQNASTWTPSQEEDLKFTLYRADFASSGNATFFNPDLPKKQEIMTKDPLAMYSREVRIGVNSPITSSIEAGNTILQTNTSASGNFEGFAGDAATFTVTAAGVGYTGSSYVFSGVPLTSLTGNGVDATADITVDSGGATAAVINVGGKGYQIGDVLTPSSIGNDNLGIGMKLSVASLGGNNEMYLSGVQGKFSTSSSDTLQFQNSSGTTTNINQGGTLVYPVSPIREIYDGNHMNVFFRNHGMHADGNVVTISGINGEVPSTTLTSDYSETDAGVISVGSTFNYAVFEGVDVGASNPGYVKIGSEIISYTGFVGNTLTGISRGIDNTLIESHKKDNVVKKYEINGISLRRINRTHNLNEVTVSPSKTLDSYYVNVDVTDTDYGTNRSGAGTLPQLFFYNTKSGGGIEGRSTYNLQYEMIIPKFGYITPTGSSIDADVRTTSATSISGSEPSFFDRGFSPLTLERKNFFDSPRMICSKVNETQYLKELPGNKSMTINVSMNTSDSRITPMVDLERTSVVFTTNRVNDVILDYKTDPRANTFTDDPTKFFYISKLIRLENPASSLQVYLDAYVNNDSDIRVFYTFQDASLNDTSFVPFPGYANQDPGGRPGVIIDPANNDGTSDILVPKTDVFSHVPGSGSFSEHVYTADNLPSFTTFRIKVLGTSKNQAFVPQVRALRVTALA